MSEEIGGFALEVRLRGPERSVETTYGPRTQRDTLATLDVEVEGSRGWLIYQEAVRQAIQPSGVIIFRDTP